MLSALPLSLVGRAEGQLTQRSFLDNFVGGVEVVDSSEMRSSRIRFRAGARTTWHGAEQYRGR
jgi:hypothetical protein